MRVAVRANLSCEQPDTGFMIRGKPGRDAMSLDFDKLVQDFQRDGYLLIEALFPAEMTDRLRATTNAFIDGVSDGRISGEFIESFENSDGQPQLRRIVSPEAVHGDYDDAMRYPPLIEIVTRLLGGTCRFDHGKLNFKPPSGGAPVQWHQDWAFYPQTNDDMLAVGIMLEDCSAENGPLMVIPGSHKGEVYNHHHNGRFVGGIDAADLQDVLPAAVSLTAPAGSVSIHHVRLLHGSTTNRSSVNRPLLLFNYVAVDAFPVFHKYEWEEFNSRILVGEPTYCPRVVSLPIRVPDPSEPPTDGATSRSLYELQKEMQGALYS